MILREVTRTVISLVENASGCACSSTAVFGMAAQSVTGVQGQTGRIGTRKFKGTESATGKWRGSSAALSGRCCESGNISFRERQGTVCLKLFGELYQLRRQIG